MTRIEHCYPTHPTMAPLKKAAKKTFLSQTRSLSFLRNFHDVYRNKPTLYFSKSMQLQKKERKFPILLFSNEDEGQSLNVLVSKYHYKGAAKITHGVSQKEQRKLRPKNWDCHYRNKMNTVISNVFKKLQNRMK